MIIESIKEENPNVEIVRFQTDGCAGQFKNKFTLSNLLFAPEDFGVKAEWHFTPTSHGKSPADGLGGTIKRAVYNRILTGQVEVYSAKDFVEVANSLTGGTKVILVTREEMEEHSSIMQKRWEKVKTIPGTRKFHFFAPSNEHRELTAAVTSLLHDAKKFKV